jgi:mannose-6-phosphate isomerase-like protein (cupin superfamily)
MSNAARAGSTGADGAHVGAAEALATVPDGHLQRSVKLFSHGSLVVRIYAPRGVDPQDPHTRDEAYVVLTGSGEFVHGRERVSFGPGDFLFVPAGVAHRFENFTDDFSVWVLFYGPVGGEKP